MNESLKDILSNLNPEIDQETLLLYLQGKLNAEQRHEVEKKMMESDFEADALEGLGEIQDPVALNAVVESLNRDLRKKTNKKRRKSKELSVDPYVVGGILIILLLIVIAFVVIWKLR